MLPPDWIPPPPDTEPVETPFEYFEMADPDHDGNWTVNIPSVNFTNHATGPSNFEFMITAEEENGDTAIPLWTSVEFTETGLPPPDNVSPSADIMRPLSNQIAQGIVTINGTATDDVCLQKAEVYADDSLLGVVSLPPMSNAFFALDFNTTTFSNGPITIEVRTFDTSNNTSTQTMMITIANPLHNIIVTNVASSKTVVGQGYILTINATAENQDDYTQTFNVTAYANTTAIQTKTITLTSKNSTAITFTWNTTGFAKGDYAMSAYAWPVPEETDTADNMLFDGWVFISIPGDINGDRKVDLKDVFAVGKAFGSTRGSDGLYWHSPVKSCCPHSPNCDINDDGKVDLKDYYATCKNFGKSW
jgi:hypothetical protein